MTVPRNTSPPPSKSWSRILVAAQALAGAALVLSARPTFHDVPALVVTLFGMAVGIRAITAIGARRVSVMPHVVERTQLVTRGPYRLIRHPMYTAMMLFCGGFAFVPFAWWKLIVWLVLLTVLIAKSRIEERQLRDRFTEYAAYANRTRRFIPFLW